jgi:hypothetical protein
MSDSQIKTALVQPTVGTIRVVGGQRVEDVSSPLISVPPDGSPRASHERLFVVIHLAGQALPHVFLELREVLIQTYWGSPGSVTAALRKAVAAANRRLYYANLRSGPAGRSYGSVACVALSAEDLFILQAGAVCICIAHPGHFETLSVDERVPALGIGPVADIRLSHTSIGAGDVLLLSSPPLATEEDQELASGMLRQATVDGVLQELLSLGPTADLVALVASWAVSPEAPVVEKQAAQPVRSQARERRMPAVAVAQLPAQAPETVEPAPRPQPAPEPGRFEKPPALTKPRRTGPSLGQRVGQGVSATGRALVAVGSATGRGINRLFWRMLPGADRSARARARPPRRVPKENRVVMMSVAFLLLVAVVVTVILAYQDLGTQARFDALVREAREQAEQAVLAGGGSDASRVHWTGVLSTTQAAANLRPDDPNVIELHTQARTALDQLDDITRLQPIQLYDFGISNQPRQLAVHGQMIFVLDPAAGWVAQVTLNQTGSGLDSSGVIPILVQSGQRIGGAEVSELLDVTWVDAESGRQTSGLLIFEQSSAVVSYDPAWSGEGGAPQLMRFVLGTPPIGRPQSVGSYRGRLYVLDPQANQIWRYAPQGDTYSEPPERYFETDPSVSLATAIDMAIDGNIYVLCADGVIHKFFGGELRPLEVQGLRGNLDEAIALAADPSGNSDVIYVADRGNDYCDGRVVALGLDGSFRAQFCAEGAFDSLEALAFDRPMRRLYVVSGGRLYVASLP